MTKQVKRPIDNVDFTDTPGATTKSLHKVAVYGSLRKGLHNYTALGMAETTYLGEFETPPLYNLHAVSGSYPGLTTNGTTSVKMEVYEVDDQKLHDLNGLEGYYGPLARTNLYNRISIETPWGTAYCYTYNYSTDSSPLIESGDWKEYYNDKKFNKQITG